MLARTQLTAAELSVKPFELDGLLAFCQDAETGRLPHHRFGTSERCVWPERGSAVVVDGFNMTYSVCHAEDCRTVCCVGGYVALHAGVWADDYMVADFSEVLHDLYYPPVLYVTWNDVTPLRAAEVVRHFLATGVVDWAS